MRVGPWSGRRRPFSTSVLLLLMVAQIFLLPEEAMSQEKARDLPMVVVIPEKSPFLAGALEIITLPTIGYAYAGNWTRGLPSAGVRILGIVLAAKDYDPFVETPCEARCVVGAITLIGGYIWAVSDAAGTARRTNEERRAEALGALVFPTLEGRRVGVLIQLRIPR